jgi:RNase P/RNase MRP subunit p30
MHTYDLHVRFTHQNAEAEFTRLQLLAIDLEFAGLALDSPLGLPPPNRSTSFEIFHRLTLSPRSISQLRVLVKKQLSQTELLVVHGRSKSLCVAAAAIPTVHMVMFKEIEDYMIIDSQIARAMANQSKPVELCLHNLLIHTGALRSRLMRVMNAAVDHLVRANCSLILTSGATHPYELRAPKDLEALSYLASVPEELATIAMNQGPMDLVSQIRSIRETHPSAPVRREI